VASLEQALLELQRLTERLRRECPWDREQTERSIVPHTVEEAYEVADAALAGDDEKLLDELGDLLFQVYFLALLLQERGEGDLEAVARGIHGSTALLLSPCMVNPSVPSPPVIRWTITWPSPISPDSCARCMSWPTRPSASSCRSVR